MTCEACGHVLRAECDQAWCMCKVHTGPRSAALDIAADVAVWRDAFIAEGFTREEAVGLCTAMMLAQT